MGKFSAMQAATLARKLGTTAHVSPLLMKARRLGLRGVEDLERLAIQRGCRYYDGASGADAAMVVRELPPMPRAEANAAPDLSNEELAVALLAIGLPSSQLRLRIGAAMLAAAGNSAARLARLARLERCETLVRYIALCGRQVEPGNVFWTELLSLLPDLPMPAVDVLPHITRFVAMTGFTRRGRETIMQWVRPVLNAAA